MLGPRWGGKVEELWGRLEGLLGDREMVHTYLRSDISNVQLTSGDEPYKQ